MTDLAQTSRDDHEPYIVTEWVTDAELIRRSGVPEKIMRSNLEMMDRDKHSGFPPKVAMYGKRRHWPSVQAYFRKVGQGKMGLLENQERRAS